MTEAPSPVTVTVELPSLLAGFIGGQGQGQAELQIHANTLAEALQTLVREHPTLRVHLFDETGNLRQHVLCFHNDTNTRWLESMEVSLKDGDRITILQAVSGG